MSRSKQNKAIETTRSYYNKKASVWSSRKTDSFYHEKQFTKFVSKLKKGSSVLDIGCAWGIHVPLFLGIGRHLKYEGVDISQSFLKLAWRRYPQLKFSYGNIAEKETLPNKKYDGFLAVAVLMHIPFENWPSMFDNLESKMKSGAIGYVTLPVNHPSGPKQKDDPRYFTLLNEAEQKSYLKSRGWKILHHGALDGFTVEKNWRWYIVQLPE